MKTIAFYSYKGGVGRTLALANIANRLIEFGKSVCMIDFDLEAPGLQYKFKTNHLHPNNKKGIIDYIYEFSANETLIPSITPDFYYSLPQLRGVNKAQFTLIPAGNTNDKDYWRKLSGINWHKLFYEENAQGIHFFLDLKAKIQRDINPDYLLIDTRTGITEISSVTLSVLADQIVFLSANNEENIVGCQRVIKSILDPNNNLLGNEKDIILVLTRIPNPNKPEDRVKEIKAREYFLHKFSFIKEEYNKDIQNLIIIHSDRDLEYKEEFKIAYDFDSDKASTKNNESCVGQEYLKLFNRITNKDLSEDEKNLFNKIRKAENLYFESYHFPKDSDNAIKLLKEAIHLNPNDSRFHQSLSSIYVNRQEYKEALKCISKAIELTDNPYLIAHRGDIYYGLQRYKDAIKDTEFLKDKNSYYYNINLLSKYEGKAISDEEFINSFNHFIDKFPNDPISYNARANYLRSSGNYEEALNDVYKAIELGSEDPTPYTTLAEIRFSLNDINEFYLNFDKALDLGQNPNFIFTDNSVQDIYPKLYNDERFRNIIEKYGFYDVLNKMDEIISN